jgi:hypothetical protein
LQSDLVGWLAHWLETSKKQLHHLEEIAAQEEIVCTEAQPISLDV